MQGAIWLTLAIVFAAVSSALGVALSARSRDLRRAQSRLKNLDARLEVAERELKARHEDDEARAAAGDPYSAEGLLKIALDDVTRLEQAVGRAERELVSEKQRAESLSREAAEAKARQQNGKAQNGKSRGGQQDAAAAGDAAAARQKIAELASALERADQNLELSAQRAQRFEEEAGRLREEVSRLVSDVKRVETEADERIRRQQQVADQRLAGLQKRQEVGTAPNPMIPAAPASQVAAGEEAEAYRPEAVRRVQQAQNQAQQRARTAAASSTRTMVVLIDGDVAGTESLTQSLEQAGYGVAHTARGADAALLVRETAPAAVLLDAQLPGADGWELLAYLRADVVTRDIPIILIAPPRERERALDLGAAQAFSRPLDPAVVLAAIRSALLARKNRERRMAAAARVTAITVSPGVPFEEAVSPR